VEILEHQQQRLNLALTQKQALQRVQRELAARRRVEPHERVVRRQRIQQRQHGRHCVLKSVVESQQGTGDLDAHRTRIVAVGDLEVAPQQLDHRRVGGGATVRDRRALED